jgi:chemotaxis protein MotB
MPPVKRFLKNAKKIEKESSQRSLLSPKNKHKEGDEGWLVCYADLMTLLCGFFIMMFALSSLNTPQYEKIQEAVSKHIGKEFHSPSREIEKFITEVIEEHGLEKDIVIQSDYSGVSIIFHSTLFFETLSAEITERGDEILQIISSAIHDKQEENESHYRIVVEGHTDSRPILSGAYPSNWELSGARASRVVRLFLEKGFLGQHLLAIGYADTRPQAQDRSPAGEWNDEEALSQNRRVVIRVLKPGSDLIPWEG